MKNFIIKIIILLTIVSISFIGCNKTEEVITAPTVYSEPVEEPTEKAPTVEPVEIEEITSSFEIPSAKKIKNDLKTKVDELAAINTKSKDETEKRASLEDLKKLCKENPSNFALFSYLIESTDGEISKVGMSALEDCYAGKMSDEEKTEEFEILSFAVKHPIDYIRCRAIITMSYVSDSDERAEKQKDILRESLKDKSCHVRIAAINRLGQIGDREMTLIL